MEKQNFTKQQLQKMVLKNLFKKTHSMNHTKREINEEENAIMKKLEAMRIDITKIEKITIPNQVNIPVKGTKLKKRTRDLTDKEKEAKDSRNNITMSVPSTEITDYRNRFQGYTNLKDISPFRNVPKVLCFAGCFAFCKNLEDINPLENIDVSECNNFSCMFLNCSKLTDISALKKWHVNENSNFKYMLRGTNITDFSPLKEWFKNKSEDEIKKIVFE